MIGPIRISAPGRICLFGEHQDYLGLPVIPAAVSLRLTIEGEARNDRQISVGLPDVCANEIFDLDNVHYVKAKDYFRSVVKVLQRSGLHIPFGLECLLRSRIPINAGASSSSALVVAWVSVLLRAAGRELDPAEIARFAYEAEVVEFDEAGGMMDQLSSAYGGVLAIDFHPTLTVTRIPVELKTFVIGDSMEPKDTQGILSRLKSGVLQGVRKIANQRPAFSLHAATSDSIREVESLLARDEFTILQGTVRNHEITLDARRLLQTHPLDHVRFGQLLTRHQRILRDVQRISTPKIDYMIDAALGAGALGAKINGSGGGGCMIAYAPDNPDAVAEAIRRAGGNAVLVSVDEGVKCIPIS